MNVDFPLILVIGTLVTGLIWLFDVMVLRPRRQRKAADAGDIDDATRQRIQRESLIVEYSIAFFPILALVLALRSFLVEPFQIPSGSMIPTLEVGDFILVNKFSYGIRLPVIGTRIIDIAEPVNGDVMVFIPPHQEEYFIKRVVGIPGDEVRYENKTLYINSVQQEQRFVTQMPPVNPTYFQYLERLGDKEHLIQRNSRPDNRTQRWVIPDGHYFMMGDNRDQSNDSRYWGLVSEDKIVGKAFAVWLHKKPGFRLPELSRNGWIE